MDKSFIFYVSFLTLVSVAFSYYFYADSKKTRVDIRRYSPIKPRDAVEDRVVIKRKTKPCDPSDIPSPKKCRISDPVDCLECTEFNYSCKHASREFKLKRKDGSTVTVPPNDNSDEGYCLRIDSRAPKCNQNTGTWLLSKRNADSEAFYFTCLCKYPGLVGQKTPFSDCDVHARCKLNTLNADPLTEGVCECDENEIPERDEIVGPYCRPAVVKEYEFKSVNEPTTATVSHINERAITAAYGKRGVPLFRGPPCGYDVETGVVFTGSNRGRVVTKRGPVPYKACFCDSSQGLYPVYGDNGDSWLFDKYRVQGGRIPTGCSSVYKDPNRFLGYTAAAYERVHYYSENPVAFPPRVDLTIKTHYPEKLKDNLPSVNGTVTMKLDWPTNALNLLADEDGRTNAVFTPVLSCRKCFAFYSVARGFRRWYSVTCMPCSTTDEYCWNEKSPEEPWKFFKDRHTQKDMYNRYNKFSYAPKQYRSSRVKYCDEAFDEDKQDDLSNVADDCENCNQWDDDVASVRRAYNRPGCIYRGSGYHKYYHSNVIPDEKLPFVVDKKIIPQVLKEDYHAKATVDYFSMNQVIEASTVLVYDFKTRTLSFATPGRHGAPTLDELKNTVGIKGAVPLDTKTKMEKADFEKVNWFEEI